MRYEKNEKLSRLIENKRIVIAGPGQYLVGKGLGNVINDYDVVCRINYMSPNEYVNDYGNRTDIMFYNCATLSIKQMGQHFDKCPDFCKNTKLVVCPVVKGVGADPWREWSSDYISPVVANFESINEHNIDFYWIGMENYKCLFDMVNCLEPNSGILTILTILAHNPKELFITGFTFYVNKDDNYFNGYATLPEGWKGVSGHPQGPQREFFKNYILAQSGLKIDSYMNELLKFNHNNIYVL